MFVRARICKLTGLKFYERNLTTMDLNQAILYAQLVNAAYDVDPANLPNSAGKIIPAGTAAATYEVVTTIYGNDLATDMHPEHGNNRVSIGFVAQATAGGEVVVAIRGTEGIQEWIHDVQFLPVNCPFMPAAGNTEDGFTAIYSSMKTGVDAASPSVAKVLSTLPFKRPVTSVTICGHSLGGALATLLALDVAVNTPFFPAVFTYASPRTGDSQFVAVYNHAVPNTTRIANRVDLVPKLPLPPLYEHVLGLYDLSSVTLTPPAFLIKPDIAAQHILTSYLYLLSRLTGGPILPLNPGCAP
jgi:hypothetical protein